MVLMMTWAAHLVRQVHLAADSPVVDKEVLRLQPVADTEMSRKAAAAGFDTST